MKFTILVAAGASLVAAQNLTGEPECAIPCLTAAITNTCTDPNDTGCSCANQGPIANQAVSCLLENCDANSLQQAQRAGAELCIDYYAALVATGGATAAPSTEPAAVATSTAPADAPTTAAPAPTAPATGNGTVTSAPHTTGTSTSTSSSRTSTRTSSSSAAATTTPASGAGGMPLPGFQAQAGLLGALLAGVVAMM